MNRFNTLAIVIAVLLFSAIVLWSESPSGKTGATINHSLLTATYLGDGQPALVPIPRQVELDPRAVQLGRRLFHDPILSGNGFSCSTCHPVDGYGVDGLARSIKTGGGFDVMNTPSVLNSGFNASQLWNGKARSLEEQLDGVINNPLHMDSSWQKVLANLKGEPDYASAFASLYPAGISQASVSHAVSSYERSLITPDSALDGYLRGDEQALTQQQLKGLELFQQYGCISCHQGVNLGGNLFARSGIYESIHTEQEQLNDFDFGRYTYTGDPRDKFVFRVPSLRNVAKTAPYFHDGKVERLDEAIRTMARAQLNIDMPDEDVDLIEQFLHSLTGQLPEPAT